MRLSWIHWALALVLVAAQVAATRRAPRTRAAEEAASRALSILLPESALLVTADWRAIARRGWGRALASRVRAWSRAAPACASEQLERVEHLALALPATPAGAELELAVVADGAFEARPALECAAQVIRARGGAPRHATLNGFSVLRDAAGAGELGVRDGGPLILSGGPYFQDLLGRALQPRDPASGVRERLHLLLRAQARGAPLVATWVLAPGWFEAWLGDPSLAGSPWASLRAALLWAEPGEALRVRVQLSSESPEAAARLEPMLRRIAGEAGASIERRGEQLTIALTSDGADWPRLLERFAPSRALGRGAE